MICFFSHLFSCQRLACNFWCRNFWFQVSICNYIWLLFCFSNKLIFISILLCLNRSTRESTPCSLIRDPNAIHTPGSTTRQRTLQTKHERIQRNIPPAHELDEFFAYAEKQQQKMFMDKCVFLYSYPTSPFWFFTSGFIWISSWFINVNFLYFCRYNFDIVNDVPLPGRYEWVPVLH